MSESTESSNSNREAWLRVALDVAGGMPHPERFMVEDDDRIRLRFTSRAQADLWADHLDAQDVRNYSPADAFMSFDARGRRWFVSWPEPDDVVAKVEPDTEAQAAITSALAGRAA